MKREFVRTLTAVVLLMAPLRASAAGFALSGSTITFTDATRWTIDGDAVLSSGLLNAGPATLQVAGDWTLSGGNFLGGTSTVVFTGTSTLTGQTSFFNLTETTPGASLTLPAGSTQTVAGALTLTGAGGNPVKLQSSAASQAFLNSTGSSSISFLDVQFSYASGRKLFAPNSIDSGSNTNWDFFAPNSPLTLTQLQNNGITPIPVGSVTNTAAFIAGFSLSDSDATDLLTPEVEIRAVGVPFTNIPNFVGSPIATSGAPVAATVSISNLTVGVSYHWQAMAFDQAGSSSPWVSFGGNPESATDLLISPNAVGSGVPMRPVAIMGRWDPSTNHLTLIWRLVTRDVNGNPPLIDHYLIEQAGSLGASAAPAATVASNVTSFTLTPPAGDTFYDLRAVLADGSSSDASDPIDQTGHRYVLAGDNPLTRLIIPSESSSELFAENNASGNDLQLLFVRRNADESGSVLTSYEIRAQAALTGATVSNFSFSQRESLLDMAYTLPASAGNAIGLYWSNGQTVIPVGSPASASSGSSIIAQSVSNLGIYEARATTALTGALQLTSGSPYPRVITPNASTNRRVFFFLDNPGNDSLSGAIYDLKGAKVRDLSVNNLSPAPNALVWDGRDSNGSVVRGGAYLFKIQAGKQEISGVIGVAR